MTVRLVSASRSVRGQNTSLAIHARTVTDAQGGYELPLVPNGDIDDLGSYYLVREWELGERAIIVPPRTDPRVDDDGRVPLEDVVVDDTTLLPEPADRPPLYLLRAELGTAQGVATLDEDGKVPGAQAELRKVAAKVTSGAADGDTLPATGGVWTEYPAVGELAIDAVAGDYLELVGTWFTELGAQSFYDIGVKVDGEIVRYASTGGPLASSEGDFALLFNPVGYHLGLDVAAGHIDTDGKVHFVMLVKTAAAAGKLHYSPARPLRWRVINFVGAAA